MHRKIDLYRVHRNERGRITRTEYVCSTNRAKSCREAVLNFGLSGGRIQYDMPLNAEIKGQFA